jgi:SAM-dependent methyltransferase
MSKTDLKYYLYERSVQCPDWHVQHFPRFLEWMSGKKAKLLREDFCGTGRISYEWVKSAANRSAVGLDLDPEPLDYYARVHRPKLTAKEAGRIRLERKNVLVPTTTKFDLIAACNFSFYIFHERETLLEYFTAAFASLKPGGAIFLEMAGGEGMIEGMEEERTFHAPGIGKVLYTWEQDDYDPITSLNDYKIHFRLPGKKGKQLKDAFIYHWRLWGIREVREVLRQAGFKKTQVFWESCDSRGNGTGEYVPMDQGDPAHAWIAYVAGVR